MNSNKIQSHRDLVVWQKAMDMSVQVYKLTESFPKTETYRLISQITRSAVSVPAQAGACRQRLALANSRSELLKDTQEALKKIMPIFWRSQKVR